uniref:Beta-2 adrenergic receptor n=1 Tax=Eptatretus burgeri TaxID=7764 RepID=A0A8C4N433_EPTBU
MCRGTKRSFFFFFFESTNESHSDRERKAIGSFLAPTNVPCEETPPADSPLPLAGRCCGRGRSGVVLFERFRGTPNGRRARPRRARNCLFFFFSPPLPPPRYPVSYGSHAAHAPGVRPDRCPAARSTLMTMVAAASSNASDDDGASDGLGLSSGFFGALLCTIVLVTVLGNVVAVAAIARFRRLQSQTNYLIMSLACADLLMGLIVIPFSGTPIVFKTWYFGEKFCDFLIALDIMCVTASIDTLCVIAVDRYVAVTSPLRYETLMTKRRARVIIVVVWIISALVSFLPVHTGWSKGHSTNSTGSPEKCEFVIPVSYAIASSIVSFYLPLSVMVIMYSKVFREAKVQLAKINNSEGHFHIGSSTNSHSKKTGKKLSLFLSHKEHRALKTLGLIMGIFSLCWTPFFIINIVHAYCRCVPNPLFVALNWLGYINSAFNPIIYCRSVDFRIAFRRMLCNSCRPESSQLRRPSDGDASQVTATSRARDSRSSVTFLDARLMADGVDVSASRGSRNSEHTVLDTNGNSQTFVPSHADGWDSREGSKGPKPLL